MPILLISAVSSVAFSSPIRLCRNFLYSDGFSFLRLIAFCCHVLTILRFRSLGVCVLACFFCSPDTEGFSIGELTPDSNISPVISITGPRTSLGTMPRASRRSACDTGAFLSFCINSSLPIPVASLSSPGIEPTSILLLRSLLSRLNTFLGSMLPSSARNEFRSKFTGLPSISLGNACLRANNNLPYKALRSSLLKALSSFLTCFLSADKKKLTSFVDGLLPFNPFGSFSDVGLSSQRAT